MDGALRGFGGKVRGNVINARDAGGFSQGVSTHVCSPQSLIWSIPACRDFDLFPPRAFTNGQKSRQKINPPDFCRVGVGKAYCATHTPASAYNNAGRSAWSAFA